MNCRPRRFRAPGVEPHRSIPIKWRGGAAGINPFMSPVEKALWYVEGHLRQEISLADIAANTGVSRHHLLRAFGGATGLSVMRYVRGRRLSEAAHRLADGASDILGVAVDTGYNSHEAFTRAFGEQFGVTPAEVRSRAVWGCSRSFSRSP